MRLNSDEELSHQNGFLGTMGDSTIRYFPADLQSETSKALLTIRANDVVEEY